MKQTDYIDDDDDFEELLMKLKNEAEKKGSEKK